MSDSQIMLFHGSNVAIERPQVSLNTGFADLGRGFYLTDDREVAVSRARMRARGGGRRAHGIGIRAGRVLRSLGNMG